MHENTRTVAIPHNLAAALDHGGEMGRRIREHDWASSPVGPMADWPAELRTALSFMLVSRAQIVIFWGPDRVAFYNDAYAPTIGDKDRTALGRPARESWSELWTTLEPMLDSVVDTLVPFSAADHPFEIARHGFVEDVFFDISYDPILLGTGEVGGIFCIVSETTMRVVGERRLRMVHDLSQNLITAEDGPGIARLTVDLLSAQAADLDLVAVYLRSEDGSVTLAAPLDDATLPAALASSSRLSVGWTRVVEGRAAVEVTGDWRWGSAEEPTRPTVLLPLVVHGAVAGVLVVTPSARQPFDDANRTFLSSLAGEVARGLAEVYGRAEDRRRADALAELDRAKSDFFSNISHEFRTPLTLLLGPLRDALDDQRDPLSDDQRERVAIAERNAGRLLRLVNKLLEFSRHGEGAAEPQLQPLDIGAATAAVVELFDDLARRAGIRLGLDVGPVDRPARADPSMYEIVLLNLLSNAFKHTLEGTITVSVAQDRSDAVVTVADTGSGIPAEELDHVFERFHRIAGIGGRTFESTGIGLALVHDIVEAHGGSITARSDVGRGSTFVVRLPLDVVAPTSAHEHALTPSAPESAVSDRYLAEVAEVIDAANGRGDGAAGTPGPGAGREPRRGSDGGLVLVVDDNADMRTYLRRNLEPYFDVAMARDGEEGLARARTQRPDLILTDVMMPGLDGFGLLAAVRAEDALRDVPVVLVSARPGEDLAVEALDVGADDYLVKPFSVLELVTRVRSAVQLARARTEREHDAQLYAAHFEAVSAVAQQLNASRTWRDISSTLSSSLVEIIGCDEVALLVVDPERNVVLPPSPEDTLAEELEDRWSAWTGPESAVREAVLTRRRLWIANRSQLATRHPGLAEVLWDTAIGAMAVLPLGLGDAGEVLGGLWIGWHHDASPDPILVGMIDTITQLTAQAAARVRDFEAERAVARTLQESVLPGAPPEVDEMSIAWRYAAGTRFMTVGGDWYDAIPIPGGGVALVVGDVVGHGAASAASMAQLRNSLRGYLALGAGPHEALGQLNDLVHTTREDHFATVCCLVVDPDRRRVAWSSAGHPPVALRHPDGRVELLEGGRGVPIGAFPFSRYDSAATELEPGSTLVLYTDGLVESRADGYSTDPLVRCLTEVDDQSASDLLDTVFAELVGDDREDDIAAVVVRITSPLADVLSFEVDAEPRSVGRVRRRIRSHVESRMEMEEDTLSGLLVAVSEAVTNAVEHRRTDADTIAVSAQVDGSTIEITVVDQGVWRPPFPQATRGFGLSIMRALTDVTVDPSPRGTTVTMRLPKAVPA